MSKAQVKVEGSPEAELIDAGLVQADTGVIEYRSATTAELSQVQSFEDAVRLATELYGDLIPSFEMGDGFEELPSKDTLVGVPFLILGWGLGWSDFGDDERFSIVRVILQDGQKYRFSAGGSGIHKTLMERFDGSPENFRAVMAVGGLSKAEYKPRKPDGSDVLDGNGRVVNLATTYHLDTSMLTVASVR